MTNQGINLTLDQKARLLSLEVQRQNTLRELERRARHRRNIETLIMSLVFIGVIGLMAGAVALTAGLLK